MAGARTFVFALAAATILMLAAESASARGHCSTLRLACDNGRNYPVCPIAVTDAGELVTARVITGRGRGVYVRLIPMGNGYRYAGIGMWVDGIGPEAVVYRGNYNTLSCTVVHG